MVTVFFERWIYHDKQFLYIMIDNNRLDQFLQYFLSQTQDLLAEIIPIQDERSRYAGFAPYFIISGLYGILVKWLEDGANIVLRDIRQIVPYIMKSDALT